MKRFTKALSFLLAVMVMLSSIMVLSSVNIFAANGTITYSFTNTKAGFAQGTITLKGDNGTYWLYWSDNTKALANYGEITSLTVSGGQGSFAMPKYTAIPALATKLIAIKSSTEPAAANCTVAKAEAVFSIPDSKRLNSKLLYTFGAISDPQLANDNYGSGSYPYDEEHFAAALETLAKRGVDFTISSGDTVNDQNGKATYAAEYKVYQKLIAESSYAAPIYEANGNHDVGTVWDKNGNYYNDNGPFIKATGLDSKKATINAGKPYFEVTEPATGDHFIFMALEGGFYTNKGTQFSKAQLDWLEGLLKKYKDDGKNIFIIEHANIGGWGSGDKLTTPYYYDLALVKSNSDVSRFVKLMETYKDCVIITGHTHLELGAKDSWVGQYNYSDNNGTSAVMIHNSAIGGVRRLVNGSVDRTAVKGLSEGYIVEVYEDGILFNGTNMYHNETMPQCSYIVPMGTSENQGGNNDDTPSDPKPTTPTSDNITITIKDTTDSGWMKNNASTREIQLIDNATNTKYVMASSDGYKTWTAEVSRSVTDITFRRVNVTNNEIRNQWDAGDRKGSVQYCVLDDAGGGTTKGNGYWNTSVTEPPKPVVTEPKETTQVKPVVTEPKETTQVKPVVTEPKETTQVKPVVTEPKETTQVKPVVTEPKETTAPVSAVTKPADTDAATTATETAPVEDSTPSVTAVGTHPTTSEATTVTISVPDVTVPDDIPFYGDSDLNGKVNIKDATTVQKFAAKLMELEGIAFVQADVTGDMKVNVKDATSIQKFVAKIIDKFPAEETAMVTVSAGTTAKQDLDAYYTYSSYDQYVALKKANMSSASQTEITKLQDALYDIAGASAPDDTGSEITVYFTNTNNWSTVYAHIWGTAGDKAKWPGTAMTYVRNNSSGKGIYKVTFDYSMYQSIIFTNNSEQTVDIKLSGDNNIGYYLNGKTGDKYNVTSYVYS